MLGVDQVDCARFGARCGSEGRTEAPRIGGLLDAQPKRDRLLGAGRVAASISFARTGECANKPATREVQATAHAPDEPQHRQLGGRREGGVESEDQREPKRRGGRGGGSTGARRSGPAWRPARRQERRGSNPARGVRGAGQPGLEGGSPQREPSRLAMRASSHGTPSSARQSRVGAHPKSGCGRRVGPGQLRSAAGPRHWRAPASRAVAAPTPRPRREAQRWRPSRGGLPSIRRVGLRGTAGRPGTRDLSFGWMAWVSWGVSRERDRWPGRVGLCEHGAGQIEGPYRTGRER